jgi:dTDP-4-amino-4,6-dideoxygalactose transaminase
MKVPSLDLKAQYATIKDEIRAALDAALESQEFILGPVVADFERQAAEYCGCAHAIGVSSGSDALLVALMALDIGTGDEVVTTPYTFFATAGAIWRLGAKPVFVDIDPVTYNIDPSRLERVLTDRTKAIMPVHLFGQCAEMAPIVELAGSRGIKVIEDAAQAIGAEYRGRRAGALGDVGCFSFFPSKNLGAFGDGGLVTTNDAVLAERLRVLRAHGSKPKYYHKLVGGNFRLDAIQAAVLRVKLAHLESWHAGRQRVAANYDRDLGPIDGLAAPRLVPERRHVYNQYVVRIAGGRRDAVQQRLTEAGIGTAVYYPVPLHLQECFKALGHREGEFPESERAAKETLALPMYAELSPEQQAHVVGTLAGAVR